MAYPGLHRRGVGESARRLNAWALRALEFIVQSETEIEGSMKSFIRKNFILLAMTSLILGVVSPDVAMASKSGGTCTGQVLGNPGFESADVVPWSATSGVVRRSSAAEPAHEGNGLALLDGTSDPRTDVLGQTVTIPSGCRAVLSFWLHVDSAEVGSIAYDALNLRANDRFQFQATNLDSAPGYRRKVVDLSAFAGQQVSLVFTGTEDAGLQTTFTIDDTALTLG